MCNLWSAKQWTCKNNTDMNDNFSIVLFKPRSFQWENLEKNPLTWQKDLFKGKILNLFSIIILLTLYISLFMYGFSEKKKKELSNWLSNNVKLLFQYKLLLYVYVNNFFFRIKSDLWIASELFINIKYLIGLPELRTSLVRQLLSKTKCLTLPFL